MPGPGQGCPGDRVKPMSQASRSPQKHGTECTVTAQKGGCITAQRRDSWEGVRGFLGEMTPE